MKCDSCKVSMPIIIIILLSLVIAYQFVEPPPPKEASIATGRVGGGYHSFALKYQELLADDQFQLDIEPTAGSIEVLKRLKSGDVELGLVQGGTGNSVSYEGLQSLGSLFYEPLWVFHRKDLPLEYLFDLRGKRVAIGEEGSGTRPVAFQLLQDNLVTEDNTTFLGLPSKVAAQQLVAGEIDAVFFVMSPKSSLIRKLFGNPDIELMSFKRDLAYSSRYSFLTSVKLGEGMIDLENNIPREDKTLLATTASLVASKDLHHDLVYLFLMKMIKVHEEGGIFEKNGQFPSELFVEIPMNEDASHYLQNGPSWLQKIFPFWVATTLDRLKILLIPLIAVMLPLLKGAFPLYQLGIRFKIFRWYDRLSEVDRKISDLSDLSVIENEIKQMIALQREIIEQVSVPLSYMGEFYALRVHIQLVVGRLEEQKLLVAKAISAG
ncbi:MAG: TAXI family TRAP transporter solute-binding subunit [Pseudomonadota bacterium]